MSAPETKRSISSGPGRAVSDRGFTLIELVTAAAIFSILGVMLLTMVQSALSMWKQGQQSRNEAEQGVRILETIARELRLAFTENDPLAQEPSSRLLCDFFACDRDGNGVDDLMTQRLRFVRINIEERRNDTQRRAGDWPSGYLRFSLLGDPPVEDALPTGGLAEAVFMTYAPRLEPGQMRDGQLSLYRGYRTPIGGEDSFFAPGNLETPRTVEAALLPVMDGLLHLEFRFWDPETLTFDAAEISPGEPGGADYTWDSTRALLSDEAEAWPNRFRFGGVEGSWQDVEDDLFPERILITVVVEDPLAREQRARILSALSREAKRIPVDLVKPFRNPRDEARFVRMGDEWIEFEGVEGDELVVKKRGIRHTLAVDHPAGTPLRRGRAFSTVVTLPTSKTAWSGGASRF